MIVKVEEEVQLLAIIFHDYIYTKGSRFIQVLLLTLRLYPILGFNLLYLYIFHRIQHRSNTWYIKTTITYYIWYYINITLLFFITKNHTKVKPICIYIYSIYLQKKITYNKVSVE